MSFTFQDYERTLQNTARPYDDDLQAIDGSAIPVYAALGLAGESGEVVELVKKSMRQRTPLDQAKVALELGDVLWYVARLANRLGMTLEEIARLSDMKLRRREAVGKDDAGELAVARELLRGPFA